MTHICNIYYDQNVRKKQQQREETTFENKEFLYRNFIMLVFSGINVKGINVASEFNI